MRTGILIAAGVGAVALATGVGAVIAQNGDENRIEAGIESEPGESAVAEARRENVDCRVVATNETGFDPATSPVPIREDAGNKQVLKGTAVGAAFGAVAGEVIGDKAGLGAAAGAGAGAAGGQAVKVDKQNRADGRFEQAQAAYQQQQAAYNAALSECQDDN